jgi:hypothetical protein
MLTKWKASLLTLTLTLSSLLFPHLPILPLSSLGPSNNGYAHLVDVMEGKSPAFLFSLSHSPSSLPLLSSSSLSSLGVKNVMVRLIVLMVQLPLWMFPKWRMHPLFFLSLLFSFSYQMVMLPRDYIIASQNPEVSHFL